MLALEAELKALALQTLSAVMGKEAPIPSSLFHYTDEKGLIGIVENNVVWATHQEFMNDPSETEHARTIAMRLVEDRYAHDDKAKTTFLQRLGDGSSVGSTEYHIDAYVVSFSEAGDLLSQWRAYAADGRGYVIEIDPALSGHGRRLKSFEVDTAFFKVSYGEPELRQRLDDFLRDGLELVQRFESAGVSRQAALNRLGNYLQLVLQLSKRVCKQAGYSEEREWRLVHIKRRQRFPYDLPEVQEVCFRPGRGQVVPYVCLKLSKNGRRRAITSVTLGPSALEPERELALRMLLLKNNIDAVGVRRSSVLYRR